jgi:hypothetical protein
MKPRRRRSRAWPLGILLLAGDWARAAETTPRIGAIFPPGGRRGTAVEFEVVGRYLPGPGRVTISEPALPLEETGTAGRHRLTIPAETQARSCEVRLVSVQGGSPPVPFHIGDLPEVIHGCEDRSLRLDLPVTANGWLRKDRQIDRYEFTLAAGDQVVAAAATRPWGTALDPMLRLLDPQGRVIASGRRHRAIDALLVHRVAAAGSHVLEIHDFRMAGGPEHVYRLTVTTGPWPDFTFPAGLPPDENRTVALFGWNLPGVSIDGLPCAVPPQPAGSTFELAVPGAAARLLLPVGEQPELPEAEPNDGRDQAQAVTLPHTVDGRLQAAGDRDVFRLELAKDDQVACAASSADIGFPTDLVLTVSSTDGKVLQENDDFKTSRDPAVRFKAPAAGTYFVSVSDRAGAGGPDSVYRLTMHPPRPRLQARVNVASLTLTAGGTAHLPVVIERLDGFAEEAEVTVIGLPAGVHADPQPVPAQPQATVQVQLKADDGLAPLGGLAEVVVRGTSGESPWQRPAVIAESEKATTESRHVWIAVGPALPFSLKTSTNLLDAPRLAAFPFPVEVERRDGFAGPIRLVGIEPDRRGTLVPLAGEIAAGSDAGFLPLVVQPHAIEGSTHRCRVMGVAAVPGADGRMYEVCDVAPGTMAVGAAPGWLTVAVEPPVQAWRAGETHVLDVRLDRHVEMGAVTLHLVPPDGVAGVGCPPVVVPPAESGARLEVRLRADAFVPARANWEVRAEAMRDGLPVEGRCSIRVAGDVPPAPPRSGP